MATHPLIQQGTLNRVRCSVVVPGFTNLNITSSYMSKSFARLTYEGNFSDLIGTATGGVSSPEPYVFASLTVGILRTQALANQWRQQSELLSNVGDITVYSDSAAWDPIPLANAQIQNLDPGAFDGTDPTVRLVLRGIYYVNSALWNL